MVPQMSQKFEKNFEIVVKFDLRTRLQPISSVTKLFHKMIRLHGTGESNF